MPTAIKTKPGDGSADLPENSVLGVEAGGDVAATSNALPRTETLDDGEIVILKIRPSLWFLPLTAKWSMLGLLALVVLTCIATGSGGSGTHHYYRAPILQCILAAGLLRLVYAFYLWATRWYVLTNRRVTWLAGGLRPLEFTALLTQIAECRLDVSRGQRLVGLGTLTMPTRSEDGLVLIWHHIRQPRHVHEQVLKAIDTARNNHKTK